MEVKKNQQAQEIDIDNNPVIDKDNDIIPEENKDIIEETISTSTTTDISTRMEYITEEEINTITMIEDIIEPNPEFEDNVVDTPTVEAEPVIERPRNTVRYIDGGFTF
jgi:hypothetical protein